MEMIYDLVTNGLARLNLALELNYLCIGLGVRLNGLNGRLNGC
jgi:hypothetical protein